MVKTPDKLQQLTAAVRGGTEGSDGPIQQHVMLEREYAYLSGKAPSDFASTDTDAGRRLAAIHAAIHARGHTALCLSGGGVRSASFAVGVLQGLAQRRVLPAFDYLSTVSGGGYAGGWLSAWLHHAVRDGKTADDVFRSLAGEEASATSPEAEPVRRIREYSSYLDPKLGTFSADVWTLFATVARNLVLNWLVLLPLVAAALLVPRLYFALVGLGAQHWLDADSLSTWSTVLMRGAFALLALSLGYTVLDLPSCGNRQWSQRAFILLCLGPLGTATAALTLYWAWSRELDAAPLYLSGVIAFGVVLHTVIWMVAGLFGRDWFRPLMWIAAAVSGAAGGFGAWWFTQYPFANPLARAELFAGAGVPAILLTIGLSGTLFVGLASSASRDEDREWWSRLGAWLLIAIVGWCAASAVVFLGPWVVRRAVAFLSGSLGATPAVATTLFGAVTALIGGAAARAGRDEGRAAAGPVRRIALLVASPVFVVLLLMLLSAVNVWLLTGLDALQILPEYFHPVGAGLPEIVVLGLALVGLGAGMGFFVAANKFSLHGMYRNRLIRAFLGASRPKQVRRPNRFTGFDPDDNMYMHELTDVGKPMHVVNMTLNLVADNRLAWQERKAESFTVSPLQAGACGVGYRPIRLYGGPDGMSLGTAITISGAAASPNMGSYSSPAITFLLTLFNARLGAWLGNPGEVGKTTWRNADPIVGAGPLLREMFGRTTDRNPYVFLSDGGHFENLGLYEMVARRCRYIVVCDAGCDPEYAFGDLGNAIRKVRIDLGIPILFPRGLRIGKPSMDGTNRHVTVGDIKYSAVDGDVADGRLIYLKTALSGDEPVDVMNYARAHPIFPHESTADQWFGESQFESYRALGLHTVDAIAGGYDGKTGLAGFAVAVEEHLEGKARRSEVL